jgi:hypothetical protein
LVSLELAIVGEVYGQPARGKRAQAPGGFSPVRRLRLGERRVDARSQAQPRGDAL